LGYDFAKNILRRCVDNNLLYAYARRLLLVYQYVLRVPDDPDFLAFRGLSLDVVVDVGANAGQSAVAFAHLCPNARIISFEPNPTLWRELNFVKRLLGNRFEYHGCGLADKTGSRQFFLPSLGKLAITTRASLSRQTSEEGLAKLERETGASGEIAADRDSRQALR
jgi:FkbM family methyltransferase